MTSLDYKVALLVAAVLVGLLAWLAGVPPGGEVASGWRGAGQSFWEGNSLCQRNRLIYPVRGPPAPISYRMKLKSRPATAI